MKYINRINCLGLKRNTARQHSLDDMHNKLDARKSNTQARLPNGRLTVHAGHPQAKAMSSRCYYLAVTYRAPGFRMNFF